MSLFERREVTYIFLSKFSKMNILLFSIRYADEKIHDKELFLYYHTLFSDAYFNISPSNSMSEIFTLERIKIYRYILNISLSFFLNGRFDIRGQTKKDDNCFYHFEEDFLS